MHVCLFDIDGTLLSSGGAGKAAMEMALRTEFGATRSIASVPFSGRTDRAILRDLFRRQDIEETPANWQRFQEGYLRHLPAALTSHQGQVLPGIGPFLECLGAREKVAVGLLTGNVRAGAQIKLRYYGLWEHFSFGAFGDDHLERDDVAREALTLIGRLVNGAVDVERVWVIGDTPLDVRCARAIGARVIAVATGLHSLDHLAAAEPDLLLADFSDLAPVLSTWGWEVEEHGTRGANRELGIDDGKLRIEGREPGNGAS